MRDAAIMAERIESESFIPEILVTSPSLRTLATANILSEHLRLSKPLEAEKIYDASQQTLLQVISNFSDKYNFIGLVGHNPGISHLVHYFSGEILDIPPGTVVLITFEFDKWNEITYDTGTVAWFSSPKDN
jgi:phosphohistidine phosphatase